MKWNRYLHSNPLTNALGEGIVMYITFVQPEVFLVTDTTYYAYDSEITKNKFFKWRKAFQRPYFKIIFHFKKQRLKMFDIHK